VAGRAVRDAVSSGGAPGGGVPASIAVASARLRVRRPRDMNSSYAAMNVSSGLVRKLSGLVRRSGLLRKKNRSGQNSLFKYQIHLF
jgi:hypothetical protein